MTTGLVAGVLLAAAAAPGAAAQGATERFAAVLVGDEEVPPRDTRASGLATFTVDEANGEAAFTLQVRDIGNVVAAHIHLAPRGVNAPFSVFLFEPDTPRDVDDAVIASGSFTAADFVGRLEGQPFSALVDAMRSGSAYVNVHTSDGVEPADTGPGDFPGGEIRGQIALVRDLAPCPADVQLTALGNGDVRVAWALADGALGYRVERAVDGGPAVHVATVGPDVSTLADAAPAPGDTVRYTVHVLDGSGTHDCAETAEVVAIPFFPAAMGVALATAGSLVGLLAFRRRS